MASAAFPTPIEVIQELQRKCGTTVRRPRPEDRVGFAYSSKDRYEFTRESIAALDASGNFDIVWNDGSVKSEVPELSKNYEFRNARLVEINYGIRGGPDVCICFGLKRLLDLGYNYVGLIENDVVVHPGWFERIMELFHLGADAGLVCGAASVRSYESRVLEYRDRYSIDWASGAGMLLLSRPAAALLLRNYLRPVMTNASLRQFYADVFGLELRSPEWQFGPRRKTVPMSHDWGYTAFLYQHGYASLSTIPAFAHDLDIPAYSGLQTGYVGIEKNNAGVAHPRLSTRNRKSAPPRWAYTGSMTVGLLGMISAFVYYALANHGALGTGYLKRGLPEILLGAGLIGALGFGYAIRSSIAARRIAGSIATNCNCKKCGRIGLRFRGFQQGRQPEPGGPSERPTGVCRRCGHVQQLD